jgi:STE24 endopeptidase
LNEDKATRYQRLKRSIVWIWLASGAVGMTVLLPGGGAVALRNLLVRSTGAPATSVTTVVLLAAVLVLLVEIIRVPITLYRERHERRLGIRRLSFPVRFIEDVKGLPVGIAIVAVHAGAVYFIIARWPHQWWLLAGAVSAAIMAALTIVSPFVTRLFFRCRPLKNAALRSRLELLWSRAGVGDVVVDEWLSDEGTRRVSAAVVGAGRRRRVLLSDTLLADYSDDEIEVIVAHELGHVVYGDVYWGIALRGALFVASFAAAAAALDAFGPRLGLVAAHDAAGLPLLLLAIALVVIAARPILNALSWRTEFRADHYALKLSGRPEAFVSAMRRAAEQNLAEVRPSATTRWLFHSHPSVEQRIRAARAFQP